VIAVCDLTLEGRYTPPRPEQPSERVAGAVVAPPHPLYGGLLTNPVVTAAARGFAELGFATMAFNYRGTGASRGRANDDGATAVEDYTGALDALAERVAGPYVAAGYSFGSRAALAVAATDPRVSAAVLIAPPVDMVGAAEFGAYAGPLLVIVGDRDAYAPLDRLKTALAVRPDARLEVLDGADHFFGATGTSAMTTLVATHVAGWF
jgi:alpha/beta superfamily hydrolase